MDMTARMHIEWQCRNLCYEFAHCIDSRNYEQLAALFTEDGLFDRVGQPLRGRQAILEGLKKRSTEIRTRHLCHSICFNEVSDTQARAVVYNTTLVGKGDPDGQPVQYAMSQGAFLEFRDIYRSTAVGWRIAERLAYTVIVPADLPGH